MGVSNKLASERKYKVSVSNKVTSERKYYVDISNKVASEWKYKVFLIKWPVSGSIRLFK